MRQIDRRQFLKVSALTVGAFAVSRAGIQPAVAADEATLVLYNGQHKQTTAALVDAFTKATGIKVEIRKGSSSQLANQIIEEGDASPADIFYAEESPPVVALAEKGLLSKLADETLKQIPAKYVAKDGTWLGASMRSRVVAYNKELVKESEFPATVLDFAMEAWKDKIAYVPTSGAFQEQIIAIEKLKGREAALNWLKGLKAVEAGEIPAALINNYYWFNVAKEVGDDKMKSALFYFGEKDPGALLTVSAAGILKSSKNQDNAAKFLAFMVSEAGQEAIAGSVAEYPVREGVKSPFALKPFEELSPPDVTPADLGDAADALVLEREAGLA
jgi:iron(III) transport system substrate-binding protein